MKLHIGEMMKRLRKERDITQEEFADILGVSCQSISRWENGACYPDIELIPDIAAFFGISVDKLMAIDESAEKAAVAGILQEFQQAISQGMVDECIAIARAGLAEYPNNYALMNKLMYALFVAGSDDADIPNWKENMEKYDAEITALGERIIRHCPDMEIRLEATERLAFNHCEMGRKEQGRAIYETLPSMEYCRECAIWWALSEEEKLSYTRKYIAKAYSHLSNGIYRLVSLLPDAEAVVALEKEFALDKLVTDTDAHNDTWADTKEHCRLAKYLVKLNRIEEAMEQLHVSVHSAAEFDNRPEEMETNSLLLGRKVHLRMEHDTADSRPLREILRDSWLTAQEFDSIRSTPEFQEILNRLT